MSTKTTFKRVALVTVAALGFGVLSVAPSNAAAIDTSTATLSFAGGATTATAAITSSESATVSVRSGFVLSGANLETMTVKANIIDAPSGGLGASLKILLVDTATSAAGTQSGTASKVAQADASSGMSISYSAAATVNATYAVSLVTPSKAGTYTIRVSGLDSNGSSSLGTPIVPLTFTVTVTAPNTTAGANSYSVLRPYGKYPTDGTAKTDSAVVASKSAATTVTTPQATIFVTQDNATGTASESFTVSVAGPATVGTSTSSRPSASAATFAYTTANETVTVWANGTAGAATITVKTLGGVTVGTHTVYFAGDRTAIANAADPVPLTNLRAGGKTLDAWYVSLKDAAGMPVIGARTTLSCVIADTLVVASCSFADELDGTYLLTLTSASGSTSGKSTTVTVRTTDPAVTTSTAYISAAAVKVTLGSTANKYTITTDKSSYTPGEQMIVTVSAVDASGNPVFDGASVPSVLSNKSVTGLTSIKSTFAAGKADSISRDSDGTVLQQYRVFAPATSGSFDLYFDYTDAALATQRATVTATAVDAAMDAATDAANEATDAANAATDAALAAADAADAATAAAQDASDAVAALSASVSKLISSLRAQITSLTNLVIKIQKKVRA
jgi:trimeric autotransporter adhesin